MALKMTMKNLLLLSIFAGMQLVVSCLWNDTEGHEDGSTGENQTATAGNSLPAWIGQEKVRAGYLYYYDNIQYAKTIKNAGMNTVLVKGWQFYREQTEKTLLAYRKWGQACHQEGLHAFAAYNWQPQEVVFSEFRPVVFSDGTEGLFICPLDVSFWQKHLIRNAELIAKTSLAQDVSIDGIFLDMEMYRTEKEPAGKKNYTHDCCFCDTCFSSFLFTKGYTGNTLPPVSKEDRKNWLVKGDLLEGYFAFLEKQVGEFTREYQERMHSINPELLLGMYPHPSAYNWVSRSVASRLGIASRPVLAFATHSYYKGGYHSIPQNPREQLKTLDVEGIYVAGYVFRKYSSDQIQENLIQSAQKADGYWLFKMPQLWKKELVGEYEQLGGGSQNDYWQAIYTANRAIDRWLQTQAADTVKK